jgi:lysophospholipase L1-like esterase
MTTPKQSGSPSINTGNALGALLTHAWLFYEGSGTTVHDLGSSPNDGTMTSGAAWGTNSAGDAVVLLDTDGEQVNLASTITLANDFTIAWRAYQNPAGSTMPLGDHTTTNDFIWWQNGTGVTVRANSSGGGNPGGSTAFTTQTDNWALVSVDPGGGRVLRVYKNGSQEGSDVSYNTFKLSSLGQGYSSSSFSLKGGFDYCMVFDGTALSGAQLTTLSGDPYALFSGAASAVVTEQNLPSNHNGNITVHVVGTGTAFTSSTTWTPSGVSGWSVASKTQVDGTHYTVVLTPPAAASPPAGNTGTLTLTEGVTGTTTPTTTVGTPSLALTPSSGATSTTPSVTFTGTNTLWAGETAAGLFTLSGGTGASVGTPTVNSNTSATATVTTGSATATLTLTDTSTGAQASFSVGLAVTTYDLTDDSITGVYVQPEGGIAKGSLHSATAWGTGTWTDGAIRFRATCSTIEIDVYKNGQKIRLSIDSVDQGSAVTLASSSAYGYVTVATGLDNAAEHEYLISWGGNDMAVKNLRLTGTGANTARLPARKVLAGFGDSITAGDNTETGTDSTASWLHKVGVLLNYQVVNRGIHSNEVVGQGENRTTDITGLVPHPSAVIVLYGTNDVADPQPGATFSASYTNMLQKLQAGLPGVPILNERLLKLSNGDTSRDAFSTRISNVVSALANPLIVYRQGMWAAYDGTNGVHPSASQCTTIAAGTVSDVAPLLAGGSSAGFRGGVSSGGGM